MANEQEREKLHRARSAAERLRRMVLTAGSAAGASAKLPDVLQRGLRGVQRLPLEGGCCLRMEPPHRPAPPRSRHARERIANYKPPAQIVQPWWFGDPAFKATGLYLRNLPELVATNRLEPPAPGTPEHKAWSAIHRAPPGPDRWRLRSRTFEGLAAAMAEQWGGIAA